MVNVNDIYEVRRSRIEAEYKAEKEREDNIFFNKCLREIKGEDAFHFLVYQAEKILDCEYGASIIVEYFIENRENFNCSFIDWINSNNGPICKYSIEGLFPEFEVLTSNKYEIIKMANEYYGLNIHMDPCDGFIYAFEFNFKELNEKRVNMNEIKDEMKNLILQKLNGGE